MGRKKMRRKRILAIGLSIALALGVCACGKDDKWLFSLNGEQLYPEDVAAFAYIYVTEYNVRKVEQLEEIYESGKTYGDYYKEELEGEIIETILLYKEAEANHIKLSENEKEEMESQIEDVMNRFGEDGLKKQGVTKADVENIYKMKYLANAYVKKQSGVVITEEERAEKESYIQVYQVTFPIVQLDNMGMVQSDAEGNMKTLSETEIEAIAEEASVFAKNAQAGENMEQLLEECSGDASGIEKYLKYEDLENNYKKAVDQLSVGEVSDVIESDYGYYVVRLLDKDAMDYSETIVAHEVEKEMEETWKDEWEQLYSVYAEKNKEYKNDELWKDFSIEKYIQ